ncbi:MAG: type I-E CRISPR-associated protein Cse1/CasA [Opitutales bacterium]
MNTFNLIDSPWIPVRWHSTASIPHGPLVSLDEAFRRGSEIADLDCAPHERIALIRLLVCITHAALGAPKHEDDWGGFADNMAADVCNYLHREDVNPHFKLLGNGPRFLQMKQEKRGKGYELCQLFFQLSSGNSPKLTDHWGEDPRPWSPADAALGLLCLQNFFVGGSMASKVKGNGPALKSLQMLLVGESLAETVYRNCIDLVNLEQTGANLGRPVWECGPDRNLLARLAPVSCALWLSDDCATTEIDHGYKYPEYEDYRDPFATTVTSKNSSRLLRANLEKGIWRDLHLLTNLQKSEGTAGPLNLQSFNDRRELSETTRFWVGELVKDEGTKAKIIDCVESTFTVPHNLFTKFGQFTYSAGIDFCEKLAGNLTDAVKVYWQTVTDPDPKKAAPMKGKAERHYWHTLDREHLILIDLASHPEKREGQPEIGNASASDEWSTTVRNAAIAAYESACPRTNPRQLQAFAAGLRKLRLHT